MFKIPIESDLIDHCEKQLSEFNFGNRYTANGTKEQQLTGIIGQSAIMKLFGGSYVDGKGGFDGGIDLIYHNLKIDIKTMGRVTDVQPNFTNNFLKLQDYLETDIYIFCSYHKTKEELTICGWIDRSTFKMRRKFYAKGSLRTRNDGTNFETFSDLYEIDNTDLNQVNSLEELKIQLDAFHLGQKFH